MKRFFSTIATLVLAASTLSCSQNFDEINISNNVEESFYFEVSGGVGDSTRAVFDTDSNGAPLKSMSWEADDKIGLSIYTSDQWGNKTVLDSNKPFALDSEGHFAGTISQDPASRTADWTMLAYYPYTETNRDYSAWASTWSVTLPIKQTQCDAHHSNYKNISFFVSEPTVYAADDTSRAKLTFVDQFATLRFLVSADESLDSEVKEYLAATPITQAKVYVAYNDSSKLPYQYSVEDAQTALSGEGTYNYVNKTFSIAQWGSVAKYVDVVIEDIEIKATADNKTYIWAVVAPFTLSDQQLLVAEFTAGEQTFTYTYDRDGEFKFVGNKLYNFKNVKIGNNSIKPNPAVTTEDSILGVTKVATEGHNYPIKATLTMSAALPSGLNVNDFDYYIRYGYCTEEEHSGTEVAHSAETADEVVWADEVVSGWSESNYTATSYNSEQTSELTTVLLKREVSDQTILSAGFAEGRVPAYQAYAVSKTDGKVYYGNIVHVDLNPNIYSFENDVQEVAAYSEDGNETNSRFRFTLPEQYAVWMFNGQVDTRTSMRMYRREISEDKRDEISELAAAGTLTSEDLYNATTAESGQEVWNIDDKGNPPYDFTGYVIDYWLTSGGYLENYTMNFGHIQHYTNGSVDGYVAGRNAGDDHPYDRDEWGVWSYVMQAYDKSSGELVWVQSSWFRLVDASVDLTGIQG